MIAVYEWRNPWGWRLQATHDDNEITEKTAIDLLDDFLDYAIEGQRFRVSREKSDSMGYLTLREFSFTAVQDGEHKRWEAE
jgi:hypothetical protein